MFNREPIGIPLSRSAVPPAAQMPSRPVAGALDDPMTHSRRSGFSRRAQDAAGLRLRHREREQIAHQVHDDLGGIATALKACVEVALMRQKQGEPVPVELLADAATLASACFAAIRRIGCDLRPTLLEQLGFWPGIAFQLRCLASRSGVLTALYVDARLEQMAFTEECERVLFRVISEAITNAGKHARASRLTVKLFENYGFLIARIEDNGIGDEDNPDRDAAGAAAQEGGGRGLRGMHELANAIGGYLLIERAPDQGCAVCLAIPIGHCYAG
ncbi:histidine kinase [Massilia sp. R2A-15]|uniref:sensor histidine kinase n=1 Tax=Massilia sp. R2A-15 TaxID=3064278 RepID=UPI00273721FE|nr:ATP-binding protein [Massilia sp. R2A-15]WLI88227.1 histidine kinase [Massilia sp. R2A-15]